jgi:hyperosmotically inducible protein
MVRTSVLLAALSACSMLACEDRSSGNRPADNTGVNERDRNNRTITPPDQAEGSNADRNLAAEVRKAITEDSSMSLSARNVKVVVLGGRVTLRGPVESQAEREAVEAKARSVAGVTGVDNQLEVKPK